MIKIYNLIISLIDNVIPANDCMDAGGRATQDAKAEAGIQGDYNQHLDYAKTRELFC